MSEKAALAFEIAIHISDPRWEAVLTDIDALAQRAIGAALAHIDARPFAELSLAFLDDAQVQALNKQYRGQNKPTNVLSFSAAPAEGFAPLLGDVAMAFETVEQQAQQQGIAFADHTAHLLIHGFYHLQGYDHEDAHGAKAMERREIKALADLGISNPYDRDDIL